MVYTHMKAILIPALIPLVLATASPAQTCHEVVRDSSGWIVQTIERQKQAGGTERAVIRDASGRVAGSADTSKTGSGRRTQFRDASGRSAGTETTSGCSSGNVTATRRDASGPVTGNSTASGKCQGVVRVPPPTTGAKR